VRVEGGFFMNNIIYNRQAKACATPIVNALYSCYSEASKFFICMLNNQTQTFTPFNKSNQQTVSYYRKDYNGAHLIVKYSGNHKNFIDKYYMTFNCSFNSRFNNTTFTIRKDYIAYLKEQADIEDLYFIAIDKFDEKIYRVSAKLVISKLNDESVVSLNEKTDQPCYIISTSFAEELSWNKTYQQFKASSYDYKYFRPEMIGNFVYSDFKKGIKVRLVTWNAKGKKCDDIICRSIGEAYDKLTTAGVITISKRGFSKAIAARKAITYEVESSVFMKVFVTTDIEIELGDIDPFIKLEETQVMSPITGEVESQPMLIEDLGEDYEDKETQQTIKMTEVYSNDGLPYNRSYMLYEDSYKEDAPKFDAEMNIHICDEALKD
jgi:hypothetical protein